MRLKTILMLVAAALAVLAIALMAVVRTLDINSYRDVLAQAVKQATGRELAIRGKISLQLSFSPALVANDVSFANAAWGTRPEMLKVEKLEASIDLLPLFLRELRVTRLVLVGADLLLERNAKGEGNWVLAAPQAASGSVPVPAGILPEGRHAAPMAFRIGQLRLENARLTLRAPGGGMNVAVIDQFIAEAGDLGQPVGVNGAGMWNGRHFELGGLLGALSDLAQPRPYPVKMKLVLPNFVAALDGSAGDILSSDPLFDLKITAESSEIGEAAKLFGLDIPSLGVAKLSAGLTGRLSSLSLDAIDLGLGRRNALAFTVKGQVKKPLQLKGVDLVLGAEGDSLPAFGKILGVVLPDLGPVKIGGHLLDADGGWKLSDVKGLFGRGDLAGEASLRLAGGRPAIMARLASGRIDLAAMAGGARQAAVRDRIFPADPLPLFLLGQSDASLDWHIDHLALAGLEMDGVALQAGLNRGVLAVKLDGRSLAGGTLAGSFDLNEGGKSAVAALKLDAKGVALGELLKGLGVTDAVKGARSDISLDLKSEGGSPRALMSRLNGEASLIADKGVIEGAYADVLALDLIRQLAPWTEQKNTEMQCLVARFSVVDGLARTDALLFDTTNMTVGGQGSINLGEERLDLTLSPRPKEASLISLAVPIDIGGSFTHPVVGPDKGAIVKGVAGAAAAAALGPIGLLVPLVSSGSGETNACVAAINQARKGAAPRKSSRSGIGGIVQGLFGN